MKTEMRRALAQLPFEEKIRRVSALLRLARKVKMQSVHEDAPVYPASGVRNPR